MVVLGRRGGTLLGQVFNLISFIVRRVRGAPNFRRNIAVLMGPSTCRYGSKVSRNLGGNNTTKFGGIQNETWAEASPPSRTVGEMVRGAAAEGEMRPDPPRLTRVVCV